MRKTYNRRSNRYIGENNDTKQYEETGNEGKKGGGRERGGKGEKRPPTRVSTTPADPAPFEQDHYAKWATKRYFSTPPITGAKAGNGRSAGFNHVHQLTCSHQPPTVHSEHDAGPCCLQNGAKGIRRTLRQGVCTESGGGG